MKIQFLGGAGTTTGARFLVSSASTRMLVDCGAFQGLKALRARNRVPLPVDARALDAVVLTRAHPSHCGSLPRLVRDGYAGPVHASPAAAALAALQLHDAAAAEEARTRLARELGWSRHEVPRPAFTMRDAARASARLRPLPYETALVVGDLHVVLRSSGQALGAASVEVRHDGASLLVSGALGRFRDRWIGAPSLPEAHDLIVLDATLGGRLHTATAVASELATAIRRADRRGGAVVVAASLANTLNALYWCDRAFAERLVARRPVHFATESGRSLLELLDTHRDAIAADTATVDRILAWCRERPTGDTSRRIVVVPDDAMADERALVELRATLGRRETLLLLPSPAAVGSRAADLAAGATEWKLHGEYATSRAEVIALPPLGGHADRADILVWLDSAARPPGRVVLATGEPGDADTLRRTITERLGLSVHVAEHLDAIDVVATPTGSVVAPA